MANELFGTIYSPLTTPATTSPNAGGYAEAIQRAGLTARNQLTEMTDQAQQPSARMAKLAYSPSTGQMFVGGYTFDQDDDTAAVVMSKYANQDAPLPDGDWQEIDPASYAQYVEGIRDPGMFTLMAKNFGIGVDEMQQTVGLGLQFLGAKDTGQWLADQGGELAKTAVYQRDLDSIDSAGGVLDWMAATIGRFGPNIVESVATAAAGAAIGGAVSGPAAPAGAPIGAVVGFFGKTAVKKALLEAAKKQLKGEALDVAEKKLLLSAAGMTSTAQNALKTRYAPGVFNQMIGEGLQSGAAEVGGLVARRAAQAGGAAGLATASNIFQQTGQAYGETMADGSEGNRAQALGVGVLGGLADTIPEFLLAGRVFSEVAGDVVGSVSKRRKALDLMTRMGTGSVAGSAVEGGTEALQEAMQIAINPVVDVKSPEGQSRLLNAFAGGALLGGVFGGAGKIFEGSLASNKQEANLLMPLASNDPKYAEYKQQVRDQLGEEEYNNIFNVPRQQDVLSPLGPDYLNQRAAYNQQQKALSPLAGLRQFAGTNAPLEGAAPQTFTVPPTPPMPTDFGDPNAPVLSTSGTATGTSVPTMNAPVTPGAATINAPTLSRSAQKMATAAEQAMAAKPVMSMDSASMGQLQQIAMQQMQQAQQAAPVAPPVQDLRSAGIPQTSAPAAAPLSGGESVNARLLRRGASAQATPPSFQQGTIQQVVEQGPLRMAGQAPATMVAPLRPNRVTDGLPRGGISGEATARFEQPVQAAVSMADVAAPRGSRQDALAFLSTLLSNGQNKFTVVELGGYLFPKLRKLNVEKRRQVNAVINRMVRDKLVTEGPVGIFTVNAEKVGATQPGAGTGSPAPAGKPEGKNREAGKGSGLRKGQQATAQEPAAAAEGAPAGTDAVQETDNQGAVVAPPAAKKPVVVEKRQRKTLTAKSETLKKGSTPERPKGNGGTATPSAKPAKKTEAELEAEIRKQNAERAAKVQAREREAAAKRASEDAQKRAADAAVAEDVRGVREAIVGANTSEGEFYTRFVADLIQITKDEEASPEAKALAQDYLNNEVDLDAPEYKLALARASGKNVDVLRPNANLDTQIVSETIGGFNAGRTIGQLAISKAREAWSRLQKKGIDPDYEGAKLSSYIDAKNPQFFNYSLTDEGRRIVSKTLDAERKKGRNMLSQFNSVENGIDENGRPLKPIDKIKFKGIVDAFKRGLARAPKIYIYKDQADLRAKNPSLYQQAVAARPQGDFDTAPAAGYSFGEDQVIIFSDRIATPKMLRMVLAHESIGHFGMRALLPVKQFNALMEYVYDNSPLARQMADAEVSFSGMDRLEAVEEYLANYASSLETSLLARISNAIKNALNKLGITFEDDITRYLVNQARRYTREGANFFQPDKFALRINEVQNNIDGSGRFSVQHILPWQRELSFKINAANAMPSSISDVQAIFKDAGINSGQSFDNFVRKFFRLSNYSALRNHGAAAYDALINAVRTNVAALRNQYNEEFADVMGLNQESRNALSYALYTGRSIAHQRLKFDPTTRSLSLVKLVDGQIVADEANLNKYIKMGTLSKKELDDGAVVQVKVSTGVPGKFTTSNVPVNGVRKLLGRNLTDAEYDYYVKSRRRLANIEIELLKARYDNYLATERVSLKGVRKILTDGNLTQDDVSFAKNALNHAKVLIAANVEYDAQGLPTMTNKGLDLANRYLAKVNEAIIKSEDKFASVEAEVRGFYENKAQADAAINAIKKFRERRMKISEKLGDDVVFAVQNRLKEVVLADQMFEKAQAQARRTIAQGYIPVFREGSYQIRVEAQDNGKLVTLHPEHQNKLIFTLEDSRAGAERGAMELNKDFAGKTIEAMVRQDDGTYAVKKVSLFARPSKAIDDVAADPSLDIDNFIHGLRMFGIATNPQAIEKVIISLTSPGSALRKALRFDDVPGYDMKAGITAMSRHIVTRASLIAKTRYQPAMRDLLDLSSDRGKLWFGDKEAVMTAREKFDAATTDQDRKFYRDELITNLYKYVQTNPGAKGWDGSRATFPNQPTSAELGMQYYNDAIATQNWLEGSANIAESTFEGKRYPAFIKAITSVAFLGGSFAQFAQNLISPVTNVIPYLASKNGKTGFGGGFGYAQATIAYNRAFKDVVGLRGLKPFSDPINDAKFYFDIAKEFEVARASGDKAKEAALQAKHKLSYFEALNIGREIREGKLIPAQANAVLETSRGIYSGGKLGRAWLKFVDVYMVPFNISEQAARRASFLAGFRLEFDRLRAAGIEGEVASERARVFATDMVDLTLGEYSNTNRPPAWREGPLSLLYMYKAYPTTSVLLFKNLSRTGKIGMLLGLFMLTGITGFPFAEDAEDIIDTLAQKAGFPTGPSLRVFLTQQLDEIAPGMAPYILKGVANQFLPMDVASKTGIGNIIPGTGFLLSGADPTHELAEVAGPIFGMAVNTAKSTYELLSAPLSSKATILDAMRKSPVSLMRSVGDVATYLQSGAIVDKRGYIVSPEVTVGTVISRLLGFYPVAAADQYEMIKYGRRVADFQREISVGYRDAWIKAVVTGDMDQANRIVQEVNDWNEATVGTPLYLRNWMKGSVRALKEAQRPAAERFLKSAPVSSRAAFQRYMDAMLE